MLRVPGLGKGLHCGQAELLQQTCLGINQQ